SHDAAVRLLQLAGCDVWFPREERCCGALHAHNGDLEEAGRLRDYNSRVYASGQFDALVVDAAGCGSHLKDFYPELKGRVKALTATGAELVVTANPGCQMQLAAGLRARGSQIRVEHVSELLVRSFL